MTKLTYADWVYEFERMLDLDKIDKHFYTICRSILREMYPGFYDRWIKESVEEEDS